MCIYLLKHTELFLNNYRENCLNFWVFPNGPISALLPMNQGITKAVWMNWLILAMFPFFSVSNDGSSTQISWSRLVFSESNLTLFVPSSILSENNEKIYLCPQYNHLFVFSRKNSELNCTQNWSCKLGYFFLCIIWLPNYPLSWWTLSVSFMI